MKQIIGVTGRMLAAEPGPPRFGQNLAYASALAQAGAAPFLIPPLPRQDVLQRLYGACGGLLLPGGEDVHPWRYREGPHTALGDVSEALDEVELTLVAWALRDRKPLLAICRGIQVLNVALGGTLYQDLSLRARATGRHDWHAEYARDYRAHAVRLQPGSRLAQIAGEGPLEVNSLHHQAIKKLAPGLAVVARAPDGVVEAVELADHPFALGVQWHPEELVADDPRAQQLFAAFVEACRA